ncbi:MAG: cryptochrome/photolyase family protein [Deltaproteobacteria bacterium]|nr:cryptochrome/photolyase family protein [Deltaproteobacteria bacterium]
MRNLILVLGDQLNRDSTAFQGFERGWDAVWMAEVEEEATHVWCHKLRIAFFFAAMRHFCRELREEGIRVVYHQMTGQRERGAGESFEAVLAEDIRALRPEKLIVVLPGDFRVLKKLQGVSGASGIPLEVRADRHFVCDAETFSAYAAARKTLVMEHFYRTMRKGHGVLMGEDGGPVGGRWNFDEENRRTFGRTGPGKIPRPRAFPPDSMTAEVLSMVSVRFSGHPGRTEHFDFPVTRKDALLQLNDFVHNRLPLFGHYEDSMWSGEPFLYHSRLSTSLNVKLIHPKECIDAALGAFEAKHAPLNSVEGFVRQILGWREFIRGIYWMHMPGYQGLNYLGHELDVPRFFWDGETEMACVRETMNHVLKHAYSHHIQRLMVMGLLAMLLGVHPLEFHRWHMALYADAVDWVSLPNTLGMSQYGDGGIVGTKPYCASGQYINRMSNFCWLCPYDPQQASGSGACPFTTLYWDFLHRHHEKLNVNRRMGFQLQNLERRKRDGYQMQSIRRRAEAFRSSWYR